MLPVVVVYPEGTVYGPVTPKDGAAIVDEHLYKGRKLEHLIVSAEVAAAEIDTLEPEGDTLYGQKRVVLRRAGTIDPYSIEDYIAYDGYFALGKALSDLSPAGVLQTVKNSGLQGRGGAGFPTGSGGRSFSSLIRSATSPSATPMSPSCTPRRSPDRWCDPHAVLCRYWPCRFRWAQARAGSTSGVSTRWPTYPQPRHPQAEEMNLPRRQHPGQTSFHIHVHAGAGAYVRRGNGPAQQPGG